VAGSDGWVGLHVGAHVALFVVVGLHSDWCSSARSSSGTGTCRGCSRSPPRTPYAGSTRGAAAAAGSVSSKKSRGRNPNADATRLDGKVLTRVLYARTLPL